MIVLITPTGGRPKQFELCCTWMRKQTYTGKVLWIVVDDCFPFTIENIGDFPKNWTIIKKYPYPYWKPGDNTQGRNLKVGIDIVKKFPKEQIEEGIFIIEDDDYYSAEYLEKMVEKLKGFDVAGELYTVYYHTKSKKYNISKNNEHSSLFQTAFSFDMIPEFEKCYGEKFIDIKFFRYAKNINLFSQENLAIGMKGLPGRVGIGAGHRETMYRNPDRNLEKLKELIGNDYLYYK
ncbi:MAG: hypothetical protein WC827_03950 [Candidatus Paceibacterota bacterium]|jgi:hypothetical protein